MTGETRDERRRLAAVILRAHVSTGAAEGCACCRENEPLVESVLDYLRDVRQAHDLLRSHVEFLHDRIAKATHRLREAQSWRVGSVAEQEGEGAR